MERNPKTGAIMKSSEISTREFLLIPSCLQVTASAYSQAQGSVMGATVSQENIVVYVKNKAELDQLIKNWNQRR
jgi:hypothetical protein